MRKHARPARVDVRLTYLEDELTLTIEDFSASPGPPRPLTSPDGGYGLTGMRERAELLGGHAGRRPHRYRASWSSCGCRRETAS